MKFKDIIDQTTPERLHNQVVIGNKPVWDYKSSKDTVYLISEDTWEGVEDEYITLQELKKYIIGCEIPFSKVVLITEENSLELESFEWLENQLKLSHT